MCTTEMYELDFKKYVIRYNVIGMQHKCSKQITYYVFYIISSLKLFDVIRFLSIE